MWQRKHNLRMLSTFRSLYKEHPSDLKGRKKSSQEWLTRQFQDPYVERAKRDNYRCRSAFKLLEMDDKFHFLAAGQCVVDCGASPGSWTQVAVRRTNADRNDANNPVGSVVAVDLLQIYPVPGAIILSNLDVTKEDTQMRLCTALNGKQADVVLSDMAPSATGVKTLDHENIISLVVNALRFSVTVSKQGGTFLCKIWDGGSKALLTKELERFYGNVRSVKPAASRSDSAEVFLLARGFKGLKR